MKEPLFGIEARKPLPLNLVNQLTLIKPGGGGADYAPKTTASLPRFMHFLLQFVIHEILASQMQFEIHDTPIIKH